MLRWVIVLLALSEAGWMVFDGTRAFVAGDYVTPKSGEYAGQLGPWAKVVEKVGIAPRSSLMKGIFVAYGAAWLAVIVCFALRMPWAWWAMLGAAVGSLWYLVVGTATDVILIVLLLCRPHALRPAHSRLAQPRK